MHLVPLAPVAPKDAPGGSSKYALVSMVRTPDLRAGRYAPMLAFWCSKADREQAVYPGDNIYSNEAPLSENNFGSWVAVVEELMKPGVDVAVICEGREWSNKQVMLNKLATTKWMVRTIVLDCDAEDWRNLYATGATMKDDGIRTKTRAPTGLAKAGLTETMYICWKGKQPKVDQFWQILPGTQATTSNIVRDVPLVRPAQLPKVTDATRLTVLGGVYRGGARRHTER